jgi:hypothetical protein
MSYKNTNLLEIIRKIESHQICLPSIQRKFEWKPDRIEMLFDSILNDYPIGTFLIWEIQQKNVSKFLFYEINNEYDFDEGKWQKQRTQATALPELWALLDGQQRLTSISIGLQGSYTHSSRGKKIKRKLYFSLFDRPGEEDYRSFRFFAEGDHLKDKNNIWIPASLFVNELEVFHKTLPMEITGYSQIEEHIKLCIDNKSDDIKSRWEGWTSKNEYLKIGTRIHQFANKIAKPDAFSYYLISNNIDLDICNEIFVRINSGGVKLSKADLLFSTVVSEWENGREKIDQLIKEVKKIGFEIDSDFVMRTCLYLTYSPILFKVDTFNGKTIPKIISSFNSTEEKTGIYDTVIQTFQFLKMKLGLTDKMLKSTNVVIPVIHHLFHGGKLGDESVEEVQKFIYISLLQKTFGSHGDTLLGDLRKGVSADESFQLKNAAFSYAKIISKIGEDTKRYLYNVNIAWAEKLLTTKYGADAWLILSLIFGSLRYEYQSYDQDHLHPRSKFTKKNYPGDLKAIADKIDAIPSLTFSTPEENRLDKKAHSLKAYVDEILPVRNPEWLAQYRTFNKIDETSSLELADFPAFFETRRQKMLNILVDKLRLDANAPEPEPDTDPEDVYIDEPDEVLEAMEEIAPVAEADRLEELEDGIADTMENRRPPGYIAETTLAILRCATKINASVPSRIVEADLTLYQRKGIVALQFNYANYNYFFEVPFTRPYLNKEAGIFANLLNLNQSRTQNIQQFQALIERITNQYTANPAIEIACQIQLVRNEEVR